MATTPNFASTPKAAIALLSAANTSRAGSGTIVDLLSAGASGQLVNRVDVTAIGTTTAGVIRLFLHNGTSYFMFEEILVTAITPSTSVAVWSGASAKITPAKPFLVPTGWKLAASTHNSESFNATVNGGDY